jgi:hypothetical protein
MSSFIGRPEDIAKYLWQLDKEKKYEIKEYKEKRSLDANSYMWVLCKELADKLRITKEEVYKKNIKEVGKFEIIPIKKEAVNTFINAWTIKGIGWFCDILGESKIPGYVNLIAYYGTSVYNTYEMGIFIDGIIHECESVGIPTLTKEQVNNLKVS